MAINLPRTYKTLHCEEVPRLVRSFGTEGQTGRYTHTHRHPVTFIRIDLTLKYFTLIFCILCQFEFNKAFDYISILNCLKSKE